MKELEAIRDLARTWRTERPANIARGYANELEALLSALDRAIAEHERLAVAAKDERIAELEAQLASRNISA